jgi:hypothetical protein
MLKNKVATTKPKNEDVVVHMVSMVSHHQKISVL